MLRPEIISRGMVMLMVSLAAALAACGFAGCGRQSQSRPGATALMPLAIGNRWIWRITTPITVRDDTLTIVADTVIRGERWFRNNRGEWMANLPDGLHVSETPSRIDEQLRVKFPVKPGDTLEDYGATDMAFSSPSHQRSPRIYALVTAIAEPVSVPAGTFSCIQAFYRCASSGEPGRPCPGTDDDCIYYSPGVGRIMTVRYNANPSGRRTLLERTELMALP
ncbi:MAG: hypothetical protein JWQ98_1671 [Chlorobi bacterium]|nr:hypothetical protein [Chlorobiota bacterium]